jgi:hypothetical protein
MINQLFLVVLITQCIVSHAARGEPELTTVAETAALLKPDADGFITIFNGRDLAGWTGLAGYWSVKDGAIRG